MLTNPKLKSVIPEITVSVFILLLLLLTSANINNYYKNPVKEVLGVKTEVSQEEFWKDFLSNNTNYIPGWVEIGRLDKAAQIDPNYFAK